MLVLIVSLMLFSCSSDSISESKESMDYSNVNTTLNAGIEKARANFEEYYRMYMSSKNLLTKEEYVEKLYQYAYDYLKALDIVPPLDKEETVGMAFANYYEMNSVSSPGKKGIARSIEIINNTPYDLNLDVIIIKLNYSGLGTNYLSTPELIKVSPYQSFALQQINNQFDFPYCSTTHSTDWSYYNYPDNPMLDVACTNVPNIPNVANRVGFLNIKTIKCHFTEVNTVVPLGGVSGYDNIGRNDSHHLIGFGEIDNEPIGFSTGDGVSFFVSEVAMIIGGSDIHVIEFNSSN